ncbi:DUF721 domain-containing protein [Leptospira meyeri]|uniref:DUF721 domain-containing protein n=1 Tax=Leptospira meyeri TaxID=29508 RepID=UPI000C2A2552|nr:DUF721 domain-containing protein [Leptospira meyeri]PKA23044.1 hypothetical protein CH381_27795 [Leptospira sp. mixed culture ATI2-C-A1]MCW7488397.1 DUF721 domain-containing protein [Leptospira meyeri]PJZ79742.1 hypothetical protein CH359_16100 [Leptospira meyeri]PJZ95274.1 hypothetical protein CH358_17575 [Leptospira meyeri]PKA13653.1 hypothetical protein CH372_03315 [Leptospira meyeri]
MKKVELQELFQSLEKMGMDREAVFRDQILKTIRLRWNDIVGDYFGKQSFPKSIEGKKLTVVCRHSMVSQELEFQKAELLAKVNSITNPVLLEKIHFKTGNEFQNPRS